MSWTWFIYSPLSMNEVLAVQSDLDHALEAWAEERGDEGAEELMETCGEVGPGGAVPSCDEVVRYNENFRLPVDRDVLNRLSTCRTSLAIDRIRQSGVEHPLQVSILRFLVERLGACLVDWGDHQIAVSERVLDDLKKYRSRGRLGATAEKERKPTRRRKERRGEVRSLRIYNAIERCSNDPDLSIDLRRLLPSMGAIQTAYLHLLETAGVMDDNRAAAELKVGLDELNAALEDLDAKVGNLAGT
jgi:hypothetical protein